MSKSLQMVHVQDSAQIESMSEFIFSTYQFPIRLLNSFHKELHCVFGSLCTTNLYVVYGWQLQQHQFVEVTHLQKHLHHFIIAESASVICQFLQNAEWPTTKITGCFPCSSHIRNRSTLSCGSTTGSKGGGIDVDTQEWWWNCPGYMKDPTLLYYSIHQLEFGKKLSKQITNQVKAA